MDEDNLPIVYIWYSVVNQKNSIYLPNDIIRLVLTYYYHVRHREISGLLLKRFRQSRNKYTLRWNGFFGPIILLTCKENIYNYVIEYLRKHKIYYILSERSEYRCFYNPEDTISSDCMDEQCKYRDILRHYKIRMF